MAQYCIGVDFGTLSGRAVLADVADGAELCAAVLDYPHGVLDSALPDGTPLGVDWALQHPGDYLEVLWRTVPRLLRDSGVDPADVIGVGVDCTASTFLPVRADGTPLCLLPEFRGKPHAWPKLWKHHAAQEEANRLNALAAERGEPWLARYGGKVSSEWQVPKVLQVLREAPEVYAAADHFMEAGDWLVWALCGNLTRSAGIAGYKGLWHGRDGYPDPAFFRALDPRLERYVQEKLSYPPVPLGARAGGLTADMARKTGLLPGTAVAAANIDAHVTVPAAGITEPGSLLAIMGTSTCHILLGREERTVPGTCGVVEGGVYPGLYGYEAGQGCVGDHFAWFLEHCLPGSYRAEAEARGLGLHALLREKAEGLAPGASGLVALDWWNGNRSVLVDADLTGLIVGLNLGTRPEEIYRALIEATAFGTRRIVEAFRESGVAVDQFYASGGISRKDPMTMQIYADVTGMPIRIAGAREAGALGSAIHAAVAAGAAAGGHGDIIAAAKAMGRLRAEIYTPDPARRRVYDQLYAEYLALHDHFGRGGNNIMKRLKDIRRAALQGG